MCIVWMATTCEGRYVCLLFFCHLAFTLQLHDSIHLHIGLLVTCIMLNMHHYLTCCCPPHVCINLAMEAECILLRCHMCKAQAQNVVSHMPAQHEGIASSVETFDINTICKSKWAYCEDCLVVHQPDLCNSSMHRNSEPCLCMQEHQKHRREALQGKSLLPRFERLMSRLNLSDKEQLAIMYILVRQVSQEDLSNVVPKYGRSPPSFASFADLVGHTHHERTCAHKCTQ